MIKTLNKLKGRLKNQFKLIKSPRVNLIDKIILTRSVLENYAVFNFLRSKDASKRIQLFKCFGDFEWYSHQIYYSFPIQKRPEHFLKFIATIKRKYPFGYAKYGRLIKRRCCKRLRSLIKANDNQKKTWQTQLRILNSDKVKFINQQQSILANYMSHHLITKLPFPYRIVFGKSITYFVLKYSPIQRNTYWLLSDLAHGTLIENNVNASMLNRIIKKILQIINQRINQK